MFEHFDIIVLFPLVDFDDVWMHAEESDQFDQYSININVLRVLRIYDFRESYQSNICTVMAEGSGFGAHSSASHRV